MAALRVVAATVNNGIGLTKLCWSHTVSSPNKSNIISLAMRKGKRKNKNEKQPREGEGKSYVDIVKENKDFETYYKLQKICPEEEWQNFISALKSDLPTAFRITGSKSEAKALLKIVQGQYFKDILNAKREGSLIKEPKALPWYPDNLAWQLQLTRKDIRCEAFSRLHNFLITETNSGNISRQEVVSMIPPIALDVKSHHKILDMCASPGSKTSQLIEYLHKDEERLPKGFVIANDIDNSRCYMLVHQAKRLNSPNIVIVNHDASIMPNFITRGKDGAEEFLKFDRILCDVPCTGDGTLRKNADIWTKWNTANGNNLHGLQFRILKRGMEMLAVGGRLVYSTCSLNPIENEAVISRLLIESKGALKLIDLSPYFPGLIYSKGLKTWLVTSKDMNTYTSFEEVPEKWHTVVRPQMFPPSPEVAEQLHLDNCIRILPHQQDTGGFFIAALEKNGALPWESSRSSEFTATDRNSIKEPMRKKRKIFGYREDPYIFFEESEPVWKEIKEFYEISNELPVKCLLTRCKEGKKKNIYLTSPQVRDIVVNNASKFKIINTGVKTFARCDTKGMKCAFRLAQEVYYGREFPFQGLWSIYPYIGSKRKIHLNREDLMLLLNSSDPKHPTETARLDPKIQEMISSIGSGSCVLVYNEEPIHEGSLHFEIVGWIGAVSTRAYIPLNDCVHYFRLLGGDASKFDEKKFKEAESEGGEKETEIVGNGNSNLTTAVKSQNDESVDKTNL